MSAFNGIRQDDPLAFFLTWTTYGTWLPGDERNWVKRRGGVQAPDPVKKAEASARMSHDACRLGREQRQLVEATVAAHCQVRGWTLHAVNCRSNHVHVVVTADKSPSEVREQFKSWCTRKLRELDANRVLNRAGSDSTRQSWWTERGSNRFINDLDSLEAAVLYVRDGQD